jgi:hypothetical protein
MVKNIARLVLVGLLVVTPLSGMRIPRIGKKKSRIVPLNNKKDCKLTFYCKESCFDEPTEVIFPKISKYSISDEIKRLKKTVGYSDSEDHLNRLRRGINISSSKSWRRLTIDKQCVSKLPTNIEELTFKNCKFMVKTLDLSKFKQLQTIKFENCKFPTIKYLFYKVKNIFNSCIAVRPLSPRIKFPCYQKLHVVEFKDVYPLNYFLDSLLINPGIIRLNIYKSPETKISAKRVKVLKKVASNTQILKLNTGIRRLPTYKTRSFIVQDAAE